MDGMHDMGGMHGFGAVRTSDGALTAHEAWEVRAQAVALLSGGASRASIEALEPATYLGSSYYVRWLLAAESALVASGRLDRADVERWTSHFIADPEAVMPERHDPAMVAVLRERLGPHHHGAVPSAAFAVGDAVRVRRMRPESHHRCPRYLRGVVGEVERICGSDPVPSNRHVAEPVYTVRFSSIDLFGDRVADGEPPYALYIDLWQRYLEAP